jgi:hypothetical protein
LVYAIAAYSITLGVLALYGVLLQHQSRMAEASLANAAAEGGPQVLSGFNVGAFLLAPVWMLMHGLRVPGVLLLLVCAALGPLYFSGFPTATILVAILPVSAGAALGWVGNRLAFAHLGAGDPAAFAARQLSWAIVAIVLYAFILPWVIFFAFPAESSGTP